MFLELIFFNTMICENFSLKSDLTSKGFLHFSALWKSGWFYKLWVQWKYFTQRENSHPHLDSQHFSKYVSWSFMYMPNDNYFVDYQTVLFETPRL
jgi:hypothetical protein